MTIKVARRAMVPPFIVMDVVREASALEAAGRSIVHLEVGQPSTGIPKAAAQRVARVLAEDTLGYTFASGLPALCQRIAQHYRDMHGVEVGAERVFATTGSSGAFVLAFLIAFEAGDRVALAAPGYPAYRHILTSLGVVPELIEVDAATRYQPTVEHLKKMSRLPDGLIVASPANPTGTVIPPDEFRDLAVFCDRHGIRLISDEIYHGITFGMKATTAVAVSETALW